MPVGIAKKQKEFKMAKKLFLGGITILVIALLAGCFSPVGFHSTGQNSADETLLVADPTKANVTVNLPVSATARAARALKDEVDQYRLRVIGAQETVSDQTVAAGTGSIVVVLDPGEYTFILDACIAGEPVASAQTTHTVSIGDTKLTLVLSYVQGQAEVTVAWEDDESSTGTEPVDNEPVDISAFTEDFFGVTPDIYAGNTELVEWIWLAGQYSPKSYLESLGWTLQSSRYDGLLNDGTVKARLSFNDIFNAMVFQVSIPVSGGGDNVFIYRMSSSVVIVVPW
jgi:hypothetical protein